MKRNLGRLLLSGWLLLIISGYAGSAAAELKVGEKVGNLQFSGTLTPKDQQYLGLAGPGKFTLTDVQGQYLLVEVFSTICPHCQIQAPGMNQLYRLVSKNPKLAGRLKIIGLGYYEKPPALQRYEQKFEVPFPLIPDEKGVVADELDVPGTPTIVVLDKTGRVVYYHVSEFHDAQKFLRGLLAHLNL
jgi:peroxiredoxin